MTASNNLDHLHPDQAQDPLREPLVPCNPSLLEDEPATTATVADDEDEEDDSKNIILRCPSCCGSKHANKVLLSMNHNVFLELILCATYGMSDSLWTGTVLAAYLKKLGQQQQDDSNNESTVWWSVGMALLWAVRRPRVHHNNGEGGNTFVGNIEAASGLASLLSALPVGYLADTLPGGRSIVLKFGGILLGVTAVANAWLFEWIGGTGGGTDSSDGDEDDSFVPPPHTEIYLALIMALWGVGGGIVSGPGQALFADSTPRGKRSQYYMYLFVVYEMASCLGPLVSIVLFQVLGDDWDLEDLRIVMYVGLAMEVINGILMMFFDDSKALEEHETGENEDNGDEDLGTSGPAPTTTTEPSLNDEEQAPPSSNNIVVRRQPSADTTSLPTPLYQTKHAWMVPAIVFVHSLVFALGSGMTTMGVFGLYSMVVFKDYLDSHALLLVPIYIFRTALMNASYPLEESILMDFVPKNQRGRWKSLESIASFGWCGSAALGGWASDHAHGDYTYTFRITAVIQSLGVLTWALLLPLVPRHEDSNRSTEEEGGSRDASLAEAMRSTERRNHSEDDGNHSSLREPLLPDNSIEGS
eukprot:scaffold1827_cov167-Amphora_coffeaeformis.AAC.3